LSQEREETPVARSVDSGGENAPDSQRSLVDDIEDLVHDARTYFDAELSYQKTRASFVGACIKRAIGMGLVALLVATFAVIGLTVGLIIALTPHLTAWGATALVVGIMLLAVFLLVRGAANAWKEMMAAIQEDAEEEG
jgi:uncharacterized membrane protein YqjE